MMKKILNILLLGVLLTLCSPQDSSAQRIEYDSLGMPHACTNYDLHMKQNREIRVGRLAIYAVAVTGIVLLNQAVYGQDEWNRSAGGLARQSYYALGAALGAVIVVELYKFDVHLKNRAGL